MSGSDDPLAERTLDSSLAFSGVFLRLYVDRVRAADGHEATREYLRHPGAVMIVPCLTDGSVVLERQWRYPLARSFIEFPAGKIDPHETLLACAQRELLEETGYRAVRWTHVGGFHNAIAYCDEKIEVFVAEGLTREAARLDAGEVLEVFSAPLAQLLAWIDDGSVTDVKTIIGAAWLQRHIAARAAA